MELVFLLLLFGCAAYLFVYWLDLQTPVSSYIKDFISEHFNDTLPVVPVSVVICSKNEVVNLKAYLPLVLNQSHDLFEVIVVNDSSTDDSKYVLQEFQKQYIHLKVIEVKAGEKKFAGKKELLAKAMRAAKFETIVVTDADCFPATSNWLKVISEYTYTGASIMLGYSPFENTQSAIRNPQSAILNRLIRFEATQTAWQYFANAIKGKAYMGVGRNMLFRKVDYLHWFETTEHKTAGGDDDLFVNSFGNKKNIAVCFDTDAIVYTQPKRTYSSWLKQKVRHTQASYHYSLLDKMKLFAFAVAQFGLYACGIALMFYGKGGIVVALTFIATLNIIQIVASWKAYKELRQQDLLLWIPLLQPLYVFSISLIFLLSLIKRSDTWN